MTLREFTLVYSGNKITIDMDKICMVNTDASDQSDNTIITYGGHPDAYVTVCESYEEVVKIWKRAKLLASRKTGNAK